MAEYSDIVDSVRSELLGCSDPIMEEQAKKVVGRFCRATHILQKWLDFQTFSGEDEFELSPPNGQEIVSVLKVSNGSCEISRSEYNIPGYNDFSTDKPSLSGYLVIPPKTIKFMGDVGVDDYYALVALKPSSTATRFDDILTDLFSDELEAGVKAHLLKQQNTRWFQPELAIHYDNIYRHGVNRARSYVRRNFINESLTVKPLAFGGI
jgi:hypothetical protein